MAIERAKENKGRLAVDTSITFVAIASAFVLLRLVTRIGLVRNTGADDLLIVASLGFSLALTVLIWAQYQHGLGRHFDTLAPGEYEEMLKPFWASIPIYNLGLTLTKLSLILQYLRVFVGNGIRRACFIMLAIVIVYGLWTFLSSVLTCVPVAYFWNKTLNGHCLNLMAYWFSNAALNIVTDLALYIMPIPVLNSLQLPCRQKYGLMILFALGLFAVITSILRLHSLYIISISTDITWDNPAPATWSSVELNVGIICASGPTLRPIIVRIFPRLLNSTYLSPSPHNRHTGTNRSKQSKYAKQKTAGFGTSASGNSTTIRSHASVNQSHGFIFDDLNRNGIKCPPVDKKSDPATQHTRTGSGIHVTQTLTQEVEDVRHSPSETSSERDLMFNGTSLRI